MAFRPQREGGQGQGPGQKAQDKITTQAINGYSSHAIGKKSPDNMSSSPRLVEKIQG